MNDFFKETEKLENRAKVLREAMIENPTNAERSEDPILIDSETLDEAEAQNLLSGKDLLAMRAHQWHAPDDLQECFGPCKIFALYFSYARIMALLQGAGFSTGLRIAVVEDSGQKALGISTAMGFAVVLSEWIASEWWATGKAKPASNSDQHEKSCHH
ncbi:hypothetical protein J7T55_012009 [Diaporthe amygdali]|uniref:uncharacterized protein n=1 Tax=Phomopsis amygdali TaxID=1214568 RepID=UPI0022FE8988|nr:uncharacterized protein J7T55_012009 [Diaporthe amygdali]KAJ0123544.1 hypothetical protein J7T55_012009 [Diaporthe amygdali]